MNSDGSQKGLQAMSQNPFDEGWAAGWMPDPVLTVSQWADKFRVLPARGASEHGPWRTARTPYLREPMDCLSPHSRVEQVVLMFGAQTGKTEAGLNWIGCTADYYPCPMLMVQPTVEMAERVSKQRVASMIEDTPKLREAFSESKSRDSGNTLLMKEFRGGVLIFSGANSSSSLASMPIRNVFADEIDRYPGDVDDEGDVLSLAYERTNSFGRRKKVLITSTPTIKRVSRVERAFLQTDQCRYFCPCPHCGAMDFWRWENIRWEPNHPETASLLCTTCGATIEEKYKTWMMDERNGAQWRATAVSKDERTRGFHLPGLYSPLGWKSWEDLVRQFLEGQRDPSVLKVFVNTGLAETWEEAGETHDAHELMARVEDYPAEIPADVAVMTVSVDVQRNRLECQVTGWGPGEESWLIDHQRFDGDPSVDRDVWDALDQLRLRTWTRTDGVKMRAPICLIDVGDGAKVGPVQDYIYPRQGQNVFAVKGVEFHSRPVLVQDSQMKKGKLRLFTVATHPAKQLIFDRLKIRQPGPGYIHFPTWTTEEYFQQVTGEKLIAEEVKKTRRMRYRWVKTHANNEALDLNVYALAGMRVLQMLAPAYYKDLETALEITRGKAEIPQRGRQIRSSLSRY